MNARLQIGRGSSQSWNDARVGQGILGFSVQDHSCALCRGGPAEGVGARGVNNKIVDYIIDIYTPGYKDGVCHYRL
jgi:hypothetical protein